MHDQSQQMYLSQIVVLTKPLKDAPECVRSHLISSKISKIFWTGRRGADPPSLRQQASPSNNCHWNPLSKTLDSPLIIVLLDMTGIDTAVEWPFMYVILFCVRSTGTKKKNKFAAVESMKRGNIFSVVWTQWIRRKIFSHWLCALSCMGWCQGCGVCCACYMLEC